MVKPGNTPFPNIPNTFRCAKLLSSLSFQAHLCLAHSLTHCHSSHVGPVAFAMAAMALALGHGHGHVGVRHGRLGQLGTQRGTRHSNHSGHARHSAATHGTQGTRHWGAKHAWRKNAQNGTWSLGAVNLKSQVSKSFCWGCHHITILIRFYAFHSVSTSSTKAHEGLE